MKNKKLLLVAGLMAVLATSFNVAISDSVNSLTQMDIKKSTTADSVDVTLYMTGSPSNSVVTRKGNNRYVLLLPNVSGSSDVAPSIGGVKDLVSDIEVKNVDDGIGGYTKITFTTTKPINIKTYTKKSAPLTQAQKDTKNIIAQNNTKPVSTVEKPKTTTEKPVSNNTSTVPKTTTPAVNKTAPAQKADVKPAESKQITQQPKVATQSKPSTTPKLVPVDVSKLAAKVKSEPKKQEVKPETKTVSTPSIPKTEAKHELEGDSYVPKMKFDQNGKRMVDLEPRVSHKITTESPTSSANIQDINNNSGVSNSSALTNESVATSVELNSKNESSNKNLPIWIFTAGMSVIGLCIGYLLYDVISNKNKKEENRLESFFKLSSQNQARRRKKDYEDIANNKDLSWQEKYKLYTQKENEIMPKDENQDMSYITNLENDKNIIISPNSGKLKHEKSGQVSEPIKKSHDDILREKLQAKISQMEHALSQTPSRKEPEEVSYTVKSEDETISRKLSDIKLKSFTKPMSLRETRRTLLESSRMIKSSDSHKEGKFVKLSSSSLSASRRRSASSGMNLHSLKDLYSKNNGEMIMANEKMNYENSSIDEYFSILDSEEKSRSSASVTNALSGIANRSGVTNPMSSATGRTPSIGSGLIVKSGYNIDSDKGFYMVNMDGVSALVGRIKEDIFILKKFDSYIDKPLQVRLNSDNVYIVRVGNFKCLVDVAKDKMGTLIEI